jgi:hypothetical protein
MVVRILQRNPTILLTAAVVIVISLALFSVFSISSLSNSMYIQTIHKAVLAQQAAAAATTTDNQTAAGNATSLSNTTSPSGNATDNMSAAQAAAKRDIPKTATEGWEEG